MLDKLKVIFISIIIIPLYFMIYGTEHIVNKLLGKRSEYDWLGRLKYFNCFICGRTYKISDKKNRCECHGPWE